MTILRTTYENLAVRMLGTPAAAGWAQAAVYTNWVQLGKIARRALIVSLVGDLDADIVVEVFAASDVNGTSPEELTGVVATSKTFANGTDESRAGLIEVTADDLPDGKDFIGLKVTPAGASAPFAAAVILADLFEFPASNETTDGVAFVAHS